MITSNKNKLSKKQNPLQGSAETAGPKAKAIKLGVDVHLDRYVVVRLIDGGTPQPPQRFGPSEFLLWVAKQMTLADKVFTCYEAGPFGYSLHRKLEKMGVSNYVVRPQDWDEYGKQQDRQTRRPAIGFAPGPLRQWQSRGVLRGPGAQPRARAGVKNGVTS
jgi:hypothetical protein